MEDVCEPQNKIAFIVPPPPLPPTTHTHTLSQGFLRYISWWDFFQVPLIICLIAIVSASSREGERERG